MGRALGGSFHVTFGVEVKGFRFRIRMEVIGEEGKIPTDLEALVELLKDVVTFGLSSYEYCQDGRLGTTRGVGTYDALHDTLEEDRLSLVVGVLHRGCDQAAIRRGLWSTGLVTGD